MEGEKNVYICFVVTFYLQCFHFHFIGTKVETAKVEKIETVTVVSMRDDVVVKEVQAAKIVAEVAVETETADEEEVAVEVMRDPEIQIETVVARETENDPKELRGQCGKGNHVVGRQMSKKIQKLI